MESELQKGYCTRSENPMFTTSSGIYGYVTKVPFSLYLCWSNFTIPCSSQPPTIHTVSPQFHGRYQKFSKVTTTVLSILSVQWKLSNLQHLFSSCFHAVLGDIWDVQKLLLQHINRQEQSVKAQLSNSYISKTILWPSILLTKTWVCFETIHYCIQKQAYNTLYGLNCVDIRFS